MTDGEKHKLITKWENKLWDVWAQDDVDPGESHVPNTAKTVNLLLNLAKLRSMIETQ